MSLVGVSYHHHTPFFFYWEGSSFFPAGKWTAYFYLRKQPHCHKIFYFRETSFWILMAQMMFKLKCPRWCVPAISIPARRRIVIRHRVSCLSSRVTTNAHLTIACHGLFLRFTVPTTLRTWSHLLWGSYNIKQKLLFMKEAKRTWCATVR